MFAYDVERFHKFFPHKKIIQFFSGIQSFKQLKSAKIAMFSRVFLKFYITRLIMLFRHKAAIQIISPRKFFKYLDQREIKKSITGCVLKNAKGRKIDIILLIFGI